MKKKIFFTFIILFLMCSFVNVSAINNYVSYNDYASYNDKDNNKNDNKGNSNDSTYTGNNKLGKKVYYNPVLNTMCSEADYKVENSLTGYNGVTKKTDEQNSCMKWYIINYDNNSVDLILDHNTTSAVAYSMATDASGKRINVSGPSKVLEQLKSDTSDWNSALVRSDKFTYKSNNNSSSYTIDYSGYKARLLKTTEIVDITNSDWDYKTAMATAANESNGGSRRYYLDTKLSTNETSNYNYGWLYDRTSKDCKSTGCINNAEEAIGEVTGYWTDTAANTNTEVAWGVDRKGSLYALGINNSTYYGVRPVISVKKSLVDGNNQSVDVGDTSKNIFFVYIIGLFILVLGIMVVVQTHLKNKKNLDVKE